MAKVAGGAYRRERVVEDTEFDDEHTDTRRTPRRSTSGNAVIDKGLQRREFGGFHFGAAFFGWLVSTGMAVILTSLLAAAGTALALTKLNHATDVNQGTAATVGLIGGILFALVLAVAYYAGGYVAGRMARFDGARQGVGVWILGVLATLLLGGAGAALGAKYNVLQQLNLPSLPVNGGSFTKGGLITTLVTFLVTLLAAMLGGKAGEAYHRKIDAIGTVDRV